MSVRLLLSLCLILALCGCRAPKVELFQKKVKPVPALTSSDKELQRQAAWAAKEKAKETVETIIKAPEKALEPAKQTERLSAVVSESLGPPAVLPSVDTSREVDALVCKLEERLGRLQRKLDLYREQVQALQGHEIEGTGLIQVSYFTLIIGGLIAVVLAYVALRILAALWPAASIGLQSVHLSGRVAAKAFSQVVAGGEAFIKSLETAVQDEKLRKQIVALFKQAQKTEQDKDVQRIIKSLKT